jgi:hypothetical protein
METETIELFTPKKELEKCELDIFTEIKTISGNKAGNKVYNRFLEKDKKNKFRDCKELVRDFKLDMPKGLNPRQEYVLQNLYLKHKAIGYELRAMKYRKLDIAQAQGKILNFSKLIKIDFRKTKSKSKPKPKFVTMEHRTKDNKVFYTREQVSGNI